MRRGVSYARAGSPLMSGGTKIRYGPMTRSRDIIQQELAHESARLAGLERTLDEARARIEMLRSEFAAAPNTAPMLPRPPAAGNDKTLHTPAGKVKLFRSLFRGRADIFPIRFVSKKTGKPGYAPACSNKWEPGLCLLKTGGKCSDCMNQAFVAVGDQVVIDHLQGRHVMGSYPLLEDETCWFLAVDFDKRSWKEDTAAFAETCRSIGVPTAIERSRSGNGAHAWFFFTAPVSANIARRMGCYLITETTSRRDELSMESYDRLFPNQDTMPRGGFGNLIALPLQYEPRQEGNSVFIDERFEPLADQWEFLASVQRIEPGTAEAIATDATRTGQVIGVRFAEAIDDEEAVAPWKRLPSGRTPTKRISGPLPSQVKALLAQRLFIEKAGLPAALLNQLKRLAAFQNPEFYKRQRMRLSTAMTPRVITCAEDLAHYISLPRGCVFETKQLLEEHGVALTTDDQRHAGAPLELKFNGELTAIQKEASRALLEHDTGVFVGPPGIGKTVLGTYLIAQRACSTLILVHRRPLLEQWVVQLAMFLDIDEKQIGRIGGGQRKPNGHLDVAMIQSLVRKGKVDDLVAGYGHVIVDECHHLPAASFERVLSEVKARYLIGLTATPQRRDGHDAITEMQLGPICFRVDAKTQAAWRPFNRTLIVRETDFQMLNDKPNIGIQEIYRALANDEDRNRKIVNDVISAIHEGRSPILLTERKDHLEYFAGQLCGFVRHLVVLQGGMTAKERHRSADQLASISDTAERLVLATGRYIGEGFDDGRLDTLFLAMPVSWKGTLIQYSGRLHRLHPAKTEVRIYDYVDREVPMLLRMFGKRLTTYRAIGYARGEAPLGFAEPPAMQTIEYDEEALRRFEDNG
jgi:superfamily II DNA or RNA helicase